MRDKAHLIVLTALSAALIACLTTAQIPEATPIASVTPTAVSETQTESAATAPLDVTSPGVDSCPIDLPQGGEGAVRTAFVDAERNLYVQDGNSPAQQLTGTGDVKSLNISTDGSQIAYLRSPEGFPQELWVVHADGSGAHRVLGAPGVEELQPEMSSLPVPYTILFRWIPNRLELLIRAYGYTSAEPALGTPMIDTGVYRLNPDKLTLNPFEGWITIEFSPDGEWYAISENNSLSLVRTDGTDAHREVLPGYREIGLGESTMLPPVKWRPDGVRVIFPPVDGKALVYPPHEVWQVSFDGEAARIDTIDDMSLLQIQQNLAPNGEYLVYGNSPQWSIKEIGGEIRPGGDGQMGGVSWNPASTHFIHRKGQLVLTDICGMSVSIEGGVEQGGFGSKTRWIDGGRALIETHEANPAQTIRYYLFSAASHSMQLLGDTWLDAAAAEIQ